MENKKGLHHAMIKVMQEVKNIEKNLTVGKGQNSYNGVADKDVKQAIGQSMAVNGLTCLTVDIKPTVTINRWEEETNYGLKQKQSVFTEVLATYQITHAESGESIKIVGYGHGQDSMDKSAGKATTYSLKNALVYAFLVPTGAIDDTDKTNSAEITPPQKTQAPTPTQPQVSIEQAIEAVVKLNNANDLEELKTAWTDLLTREERLHPDVIAEKKKLKTKLS